MTFKLELISTLDDSTIETSEVDTFKEAIEILDANTDVISNMLNKGNRKLIIDYNNINILSISEENLTYTLDFKNLINKIDLSLLSFSPLSLILQEYVLNKNNIDILLDKFNNLKIPNIALIKFNNGKGYCVDDLLIDGYSDVEAHFKIENRKIIVNLITEEKVIKKSSSYSLEDIDEIILFEFNKYCVFELQYKSKDYV